MTQAQPFVQPTFKIAPPNFVVAEPDNARFPEVGGHNLLRVHTHLPKAFEGSLNIVFVAFKRRQQHDIDSWLPLTSELETSHLGLLTYELPVIHKMNRLSRMFINEGMRAGIPDYDTRARTITLYTDKQAFRRQLQMPSEDTMYVLLVDDKGQVLWRTEGPFTQNKAINLIQEIETRSHAS